MIGCGWRSGANQSMLIWELTLYKAKFGHIKHHSELSFEGFKNAEGKTIRLSGGGSNPSQGHK